MTFTRLTLAFAAAQLFAVAAFAQPQPAESYPAGSTQPSTKAKATSQEKAQAKATRKEEGAAAAKDGTPAEGNPVPAPAAKVSKSDRKQASAQRKAETAQANKSGEITAKGETGVAK